MAVFRGVYLSRYVLLVTQAGGVGVLSSNTVHGVIYLRSCPAVHLERRGYPLKWVSLDPTAETPGKERAVTRVVSVIQLGCFEVNDKNQSPDEVFFNLKKIQFCFCVFSYFALRLQPPAS